MGHTTIAAMLLWAVACAAREQVLLDGDFEAAGNATVWRPFLSGFYRSEAQCRSGLCMSVTPHHFFGAWQHVPLPGKTEHALLTLSAFVNSEWAFAVKATLSLTLVYADGARASVAVALESGVPGYRHVCRAVQLEKKPLASLTLFIVASPLSPSYGTLFVDDVALWLAESAEEASPVCAEPPQPAKAAPPPPALAEKTSPEPAAWGRLSGEEGAGAALCTVAVVQPRDSDYVARLSEALRKAPVVVVLYAGQSDPEEEFSRMSGVISGQSATRLVVVSGSHKGKVRGGRNCAFCVVSFFVGEQFPLNWLREAGQRRCPRASSHALHLEAGMMPSSSLRAARLPLAALPRALWVLPAFEVAPGPHAQIADREALGRASPRPLQIGRHVLSYFSTNFSQWQACSRDYAVRPVVAGPLAEELGRGAAEAVPAEVAAAEPDIFNRHFAPVLIVPRAAVSFDARFEHHGHERASVVADWMMRPGALFMVSCDAFVTRVRDGETPLAIEETVNPAAAFRIWKTYYHFLGERLAQHGATHLAPLFRAMPFVDEGRDHRLDRPLRTRVLVAVATVAVSLVVLRSLLRRERTPHAGRHGTMVKEL